MYIQLEGQILYYEMIGEGKPMILLHGNGEDHSIFDKLSEAWKDTYCMYLIDSRGHGLSATPSEYHYSDMAADVVAFVNALHIENPIILGFSDGGIQALMIGIYHPNLASKLIVCGANLWPKGINMWERRAIKKDYKKTKDARKLMMLNEPNISDAELAGIVTPTVIISGEKDCILPKHTEYIASHIKGATRLTIANEGHSSYIVHSDRLSQEVF